MKKSFFILLFLLAFLIAIPIASSQTSVRNVYDDFESGTISTDRWILGGSPSASTAHTLGGSTYSMLLPGSGNNVRNNSKVANWTNTAFSWWMYIDSTTMTQENYYGHVCSVGLGIDVGGSGNWEKYESGSWAAIPVSATTGRGDVEQTWVQIRAVANQTNGKTHIRIGDTDADDIYGVGTGNGCADTTNTFRAAAQFHNVYFDNFTYWDYDVGGWDGMTGGGSTFSVTASDVYDSSALSNFTVTLYNSTFSQTNSTSSGTITYSGIGGLMNINVSSDEGGGFFNVSYPSYDTGTNLNAQLHQAAINVYAYNSITGLPVRSFNADLNGTLYSSTSGGYIYFRVDAGSYEINLTGSAFVTTKKNITITNLQNQTQNISLNIGNFGFDNCDAFSSPVLNITAYDESSTSSVLNTTLEGYLVYTLSGVNYNDTFNFAYNASHIICMSNNLGTVIADGVFLYDHTGGFTERWYLTNATLINSTKQVLPIYNFASTTGVSELDGVVRDTSFDYNPNIIVKLMRFYPGEYSYRTVQMDKSDNFGQVVFHVIESSQDYILVFESGGVEIKRTNPSKFVCTAGVCSLTYIVDAETTETKANLLTTSGYNNVTQIYQLNWTDTTGLTSNVRLLIQSSTGTNMRTICNTNTSSSSGSMSCNTTGYSGNLVVKVFKSQSPEVAFLTEFIHKVQQALSNLAGVGRNEGGLWATGLGITLTAAGATVGAVAAIVLFMVSMVMVYFFGLLNILTLSILSLFFLLSIIIIVLLKRK